MANILFVVADKTSRTDGENWLGDFLVNTGGHVVTYADDDDPEVSQDNYDCAILSDSCNFGLSGFGAAYTTNWTKGVLVASAGWVARSLAGLRASHGRDSLAIADATSPLAAGLTSPVTVFTSSQSLGDTTSLGSGAIVVFQATTSASYAIFTYETASTMYGGVIAPGRRIGMGFKEASWPALTADGQTIWLNAVTWAASVANQPPEVTLLSPPGDITVPAGTEFVVRFAASDPEDDDISGSAEVTSSNTDDGTAGVLGTGSGLTIDTTGWADGARTITVTASDTADPPLTDTASFVLTIGTAAAAGGFDIARFKIRAMGGII